MNFDGKLVSQRPKIADNLKVKCECCSKDMDLPILEVMCIKKAVDVPERYHAIYHYLGTKHFIYESKSGSAVSYCSKWCRNKHNHRFN